MKNLIMLSLVLTGLTFGCAHKGKCGTEKKCEGKSCEIKKDKKMGCCPTEGGTTKAVEGKEAEKKKN